MTIDEKYLNKWGKRKYKSIGKRIFKFVEPVYFSACSEVMGDKFKEGMVILDYGCGEARYSNFLSLYLKDFTYYGVEPDSEHGRRCIESAKTSYGIDERVNVGYIGEEFEKKALKKANVVLLVSIFTHLKIEETEKILRKFKPIIKKGGIVVFTMIIAPKYSISNDTRYTLDTTYGVVQNTKKQIKDLQNALQYSIRRREEWLSPTGWLHSIYVCKKI